MLKNNQSQSQDKKIYSTYKILKYGGSPEIFPLKREIILSKFTQKDLDSCWESLSINIIQNYQRGKGTSIKGFGTFTYKGPEVNLEGVTNEIIKDKKERLPVFLVSKEFNENLKPGEYTKEYGIRYFTSKENKNIPIANLNYSEIAFSLSMSKDKVFEIIKNLIQHISDAILKKKFKNKLMPGLGVLLLKQNILAVKFEENFENNIKDKNRKLNIMKNNISLDMCFDDSKESFGSTCPNLYQTAESIKATNSLTTECKQSAKNYLRKNYNIYIKDNNSGRNLYNKSGANIYNTVLGEEKKGNIFFNNHFFFQKNNPFSFLNDYNTKTASTPRNKILKTEIAPIGGAGRNPLLNLDNNILKTLTYFKGSMIKDSKDLDVHKTGSISKEEAITILMKNIPELNHNLSQEIIEHYFISDQIDYMKLIALLIRGSKNCFIKKKNYFNFKKFFVNTKNNKNDGLNQSNGFHNNIQKNINLKSIIQKQKDKKIAIIHEAEKEAEEKEKENYRYKKILKKKKTD